MNFFNLALNNIRKKFNSYLIYLISAVFAVTIFNIFCSMYYNPQFSKYRFGTGKMAILFKISSVAVILFAAIFILYANKFFVKTRKKEIAIYSMLGMRKRQIGRMLFYENIVIGILAITCGIILGTLFSRFFCMIMLSLMKQVPKVSLHLEWEAVVITIVAFLVLFIINSANAYAIIYRYRLIELLSAEKEGEKIPKYSIAGGILSVIILAAAYFYALSIDYNKGGIKNLPNAFVVMLLIVSGTYLFFGNFIPMLVLKLKNNKNFYYKPTNFISMSQIVYRIKANSRMLSMIAILSAITVTMISATFILYKGFEMAGAYYVPFHFLSYDVKEEKYKEVVDAISKIGEVKLLSSNRFTLIEAVGQNTGYALDVKSDLNPGEVQTVFYQPGDPFPAYILSSSDYQKIIDNLHVEKGSLNNQKTDFNLALKDNECYFIDGNVNTTYCKSLTGSVKLDAGNQSESFVIAGKSMHKYLGLFKKIRRTTIVLNDKMYKEYLAGVNGKDTVSFMGLMFDKPMRSKNTVDAINQLVPENGDVRKIMNLKNLSYYDLNSILYVQYGAYLFIGTFLGILFLLASGSIMYYKQIIEAQEEIGRYAILRKTGMNKLEIKKSISKQLSVVFGMPLFIGLVHSLFALITYRKAMMLVAEQVTYAYVLGAFVGVIYIMIYFFYYRLSVNSYMKIVWGKN